MAQTPANQEVLRQLETALDRLRSDSEKTSFPEKEMWELSERLITSIELLKHPVEQKIIQHHVPRIIWIASCSFPVFMPYLNWVVYFL
ncbi:MAG: hypothetical protein JWQ40_5087 [Segetibacter sp.]|nr:hypothetical protein [Segetibacter sp.]